MKTGLSSNGVNTIFIDNLDRTWIATDTGVFLYVSGNLFRFEVKNHIEILRCMDIKQDSKNNIWFASYGNGIYKFENDVLVKYDTSNGLINNKVNNIFIKDDLVYIGTDDGLSIYNTVTNSFVSPKINQFKKYANFSVIEFIEIDNKVYFITLNDGLFKIINQKKIDPRIVKLRNHNYVTSLFVWQGKVYEGRSNKVNIYTINDYINNANPFHELPIANVKKFTIRGERLAAISGALYESSGGLFIIRPNNTFREFILADDNISKSFTSIAINKKTQKSYVGTENNGFLIFDVDPNKAFFQSHNSIVNKIKSYKNKTYFVYNDKIEVKSFKDELLYKITADELISSLQETNKSQKVKFLNIEIKNDKIYLRTNIGVFILAIDLSTSIKINDSDSPLTFLNNQLYSFDTHYSQLKNNDFIGSLYEDNPNQLPYILYESVVFGNKIVVSTKNKGLYLIENNKSTSLVYNKVFPESNVNFIKKTKDNKLLVVTDFSGVFELDPLNNFKTTHHIAPIDLVGKKIFFSDNYKNFYVVGTEAGVEFLAKNKRYILNSDYGLPRFNYNSGEVVDSTLYIGSIGGYYKFNIEKFLNYDNKIKKVEITSIVSTDKESSFTWLNKAKNKIEVNKNKAPLVINFVPFTVNDSRGHKVRYKINKNATWSNYSKEMFVQLLDLSEDSYSIELEFLNEINQNTQQIHLIDIEVKHSLWPKFLFSVLIITLLFYVIKTIKKRYNKIQDIAELNFSLKEETSQKLDNTEVSNNLLDTSLEMKMLLNSLNSHFIFNVINYLQYNILQNENKEALRYNECFSRFFRILLSNAKHATVSIKNELEFITNYVALERSRFEYEIDFNTKIDENLDLHEIEIPTFILHPVLEILFNYSFFDNVDKASITIEIEDICEESIQISYLYNGQSIQDIENNQINRFNKSLALLLNCLRDYNNDQNAHFFYYSLPNNINKISFILNA